MAYENEMIAPTNHVRTEPELNLRAPKKPQKMHIWPGTLIVGAVYDQESVAKGTRYKVVGIAAEAVKLDQVNDKDDECGKAFELSHEQVGKSFFPSCCHLRSEPSEDHLWTFASFTGGTQNDDVAQVHRRFG